MSTEPRPVNRRARTARIIIAALTLAVLGLLAVVVRLAWPATYPEGPWAELAPEEVGAPWTSSDETYRAPESDRLDDGWHALNAAMREKDREAFLAFASGEAKEQMARWWDNTSQIGWETAYMLPASGHREPVREVFLGAELAFSASPARGSGSPDAGLRLTQGFPYHVTVEGERRDLQITSLEPVYEMPWDQGELHVVTREHVVLYGLADEADLVEAAADEAERAAVIALESIERLSGQTYADGFVSAITNDEDRFLQWQWSPGIDAAGFARPTSRPFPSDYLPVDVAVGEESSGMLVTLGPGSADQRLSTFVHEFGHALHYIAQPVEGGWGDLSASEGFARFFEEYSGVEDIYYDFRVKNIVATEGLDSFSADALRDAGNPDRVAIAYAAAGLYFKFVDETGGDAWQIALDAFHSGAGLEAAIGSAGPEFSESAWQAWVASL